MSVSYRAVQWSPAKKRYDLVVGLGVLVGIGAFVLAGKLLWTGEHAISDEVLVIRALGATALLLLHVVLCIGPLARLNPRLSFLLSNRRHLGVVTFLVSLAHAILATGYYHAFSDTFPLVSLLTNAARSPLSLGALPFEWAGIGALVILFLLAATSHDFWLKHLSPRVWKALHMSVYLAYALLVAHVALGALQSERSLGAWSVLSLGVLCVSTLHALAGVRERRGDGPAPTQSTSDLAGWLDAGPASDIPLSRARVVCARGGERIAVFRHEGGVSAVTNVCAHQGGPLGEGRVIDGCITCPWHGWQYRPEDGCAPPPFVEKIRTYQVRVVGGRVLVDPKALAPGTPVPPAREER